MGRFLFILWIIYADEELFVQRPTKSDSGQTLFGVPHSNLYKADVKKRGCGGLFRQTKTQPPLAVGLQAHACVLAQ